MDILSITGAIAYAYGAALDPEPTAALYWDCTPRELRKAVKETRKRFFPKEGDCEWWEDFLSAHKWLAANPDHPEAEELLKVALNTPII